jgi:starch phosphorylase
VLFPNEEVLRASELRIKQQYFFVSASLQDILRRYKADNANILDLDKKIVIQLNGSRCAIAIAEFMRLLVDRERLPWVQAWELTRKIFTYTSHAVSRDNLESWPVYLVEQIIPRHMQIIYEINQRHLDEVQTKYGRNDLRRELSIIEEGEVKRVKMASLAILGSSSVNGVSREQSEMVEKSIFGKLPKFVPTAFQNITHGIDHRRWLLCSNKPLSNLVCDTIGQSWTLHPEELAKLMDYVRDDTFLFRLGDIKHSAKRRLAEVIKRNLNWDIDPQFFFDVHCHKIHPYKRQVLHILYILDKYQQIRRGEDCGICRLHIFGGKASPSDFLAKQIIYLINIVGEIIAKDPAMENKLKVIFIPDFGITWAEHIIPAADLSEQISTPGQEASGTSNMKFAINGAVSILSRGGSNLEMIERVGQDNVVTFGRNTEELHALTTYNPSAILAGNKRLSAIFAFLEEVLPTIPNGHAIYPLLASLRDADPYFVLLDFEDYIQKQHQIDELYHDRLKWYSMALHNIAQSGWFTSDRAVSEYCQKIWKVSPS